MTLFGDQTDRSVRRRHWRRAVYVGLLILLVSVFRSTVADWNDVLSGSMEPAIVPGDRLLISKTAYEIRLPFTNVPLIQLSGPERGDVIVFTSPEDGERMIKRVVGLPGDVISLRRGILSINGQPGNYQPADRIEWRPPIEDGLRSYVAMEKLNGHVHAIVRTPLAPGPSIMRVQVPAGHVYVLGDNRDNSEDSRFFGAVPIRNIIGKAKYVVISLDHSASLRPRWERFCSEIR